MTHVLTLIADPAKSDLKDSIVAAVRDALTKAGARVAAPDWLATSIACDLPFSSLAGDRALATARSAVGSAPIDAAVLPVDGRRKWLLVADMESTLIENEMLDDLAAMVGIGEEVAAITRAAMNGELDFKNAVRERVALLTGLPIERMEEAAAQIRLMPGARTLVQTMKAHGAYTAIVSGGFLFFTNQVRGWLGADFDQANNLEIASGSLTGEVSEPVLDRDGKLNALKRLAHERKLTIEQTLSVGDGDNDLPMLQAAGLGVAFHAKKRVAEAVRVRIDHGDLTALLYLQGYRQSEFVSA
jgi:phosphoserine phosphatase